jgi:hypothetical protein
MENAMGESFQNRITIRFTIPLPGNALAGLAGPVIRPDQTCELRHVAYAIVQRRADRRGFHRADL